MSILDENLCTACSGKTFTFCPCCHIFNYCVKCNKWYKVEKFHANSAPVDKICIDCVQKSYIDVVNKFENPSPDQKYGRFRKKKKKRLPRKKVNVNRLARIDS
jgi:hypothetical protein